MYIKYMFKKLAGATALLFIVFYANGSASTGLADKLSSLVSTSQGAALATSKFLVNFSDNIQTFPHNEQVDLNRSAISFLHTANSDPVTINTCEPIPVVVSKKNAEALTPVVLKIIDYLNNDLGLTFAFVGTTDKIASSTWFRDGHGVAENYGPYYSDYAPILVSLVKSSKKSDLLKSPESAGAAITHVGKGNDSTRIVTGAIALNNKIVKLDSTRDDTKFAETVLLHEFSHILGLDHSSDGVLQESLHVEEYYSKYPSSVEQFFQKSTRLCR